MSSASELSRRLAEQAEAVCRAYLPNGRRSGRYWVVGDVSGAKGRSLFVKLSGDASGRWTDAATGDYGDLLDLIRLNRSLSGYRETLQEARQFLHEPEAASRRLQPSERRHPPDRSSAARRLYALSTPVPGTLAETYLRRRAIAGRLDWPSLRFHPACYYRADEDAPVEAWPALIGAVTGLDGAITGLQRTWLGRDGGGKAPLADPRRSMGHLLGNAVRFGKPHDLMAVGEGIETVLSLLSLLPGLPVAAALSAAHLAAIQFPPGLQRFYVLRDNDDAGAFAELRLRKRCAEAGLDCRVLQPVGLDLNADLRSLPAETVAERMLAQMAPDDASRFAR